MNIEIILDGITLPIVHYPFTRNPLENAADILTLDGTLYTDFITRRQSWNLHWAKLHEDDYNTIKNLYDLQWSNKDYHLLNIAYYNVIDQPVRMTLNEQDIKQDGCYMVNVDVTLTQANPLTPVPS